MSEQKKTMTYEEGDAWLREVQLGKRTDLPDGRSVEQAREDVHNPKNAEDKAKEARQIAFEAKMKLNKDELLKEAENVGLKEFTDRTTKEVIVNAILDQAEKIVEVE